jgi:methylphosphotriester-DNA--protein-cysteine methyltransferase
MAVTDIISPRKLRRMIWANEQHKREHAELSIEHTCISKYHGQYWFRKSRGMTMDELMVRYRRLAEVLTALEEDMAQYDRLLYLHMVATDEARQSFNPFGGINFKETNLVQTTMF